MARRSDYRTPESLALLPINSFGDIAPRLFSGRAPPNREKRNRRSFAAILGALVEAEVADTQTKVTAISNHDTFIGSPRDAAAMSGFTRADELGNGLGTESESGIAAATEIHRIHAAELGERCGQSDLLRGV